MDRDNENKKGICEVGDVRDETEKNSELPSSILGCSFTKKPDKLEDIKEYFFESDHLALKGNKDYHSLLRSMIRLEAQKIQAINDIDILFAARKMAMDNPLDLVHKLQRGETLELPDPIQIEEMPNINWDKYPMMDKNERKPKKTKAISEEGSNLSSEVDTPDESGGPNERQVNNMKTVGSKLEQMSSGELLVRGRIFQSHKPVTFNQPWTVEEQRRLEDLLQKYPTEETEMERWKKIASEMGNRTPIQVQSRVQKYFVKLHRAGLPIPGRLPPQRNKNRYYSTGGGSKKGNSVTKLLTTSSTFLTSVVPEVKMEEEKETEFDLCRENNIEDNYSSDDEWPEEAKQTPEYKELRWLLRIRLEKEAELMGGTSEHLGVSCARCGQSPILGTRWSCTSSVCRLSFCNNCVGQGYVVGSHLDSHKMRPIRGQPRCNTRDVEYNI